MTDDIRERIMGQMKARAEAELGYAPPPETWEPGSRIQPDDNPFEVMGLPNARVRGYKLELVMAIKEAISEQELTQRRVAALSGLSQPDVSKLVRGQFSGFTIDRLLEVFVAIGGELESQARVPHGKVAKGQPVPVGSARLVAL